MYMYMYPSVSVQLVSRSQPPAEDPFPQRNEHQEFTGFSIVTIRADFQRDMEIDVLV